MHQFSICMIKCGSVNCFIIVGESSTVATLTATKYSEETILVLLLWEGISNQSTTESLDPVRKTIDNEVCIPLVMAAVGIYAKSIKKKQKDRLY